MGKNLSFQQMVLRQQDICIQKNEVESFPCTLHEQPNGQSPNTYH